MVIWGASFVVTRMAVAEVRPLTLAFARFLIALAVMWPFVRRALARPRPSDEDRRDLFLVGFLGVTLAFVFENYGLAYTTASHGALIVATTPIATALSAAALARRWPRPRLMLGLLLALAGVGWIVGGEPGGEGSGTSGGGASLLGDLLILGSVGIWVVYAFLVNRLSARHPASVVTASAILWGTVTLAPLAAGEVALQGFAMPSLGAWAAVVVLGVFCSALGYLWWNAALGVLGVTATNSLIYGIPLVAVAGGVLFLGEPLTLGIVAGGVLVVVGLVVANTRG
jgi:drug/metabolite transporter (DMT)-like permease